MRGGDLAHPGIQLWPLARTAGWTGRNRPAAGWAKTKIQRPLMKARKQYPPRRINGAQPSLCRSGTTLVEMVVSAFLLAIISLSLIGTLIFASSMTRLNGHAVVARNVTQSFIERMQMDDFDHIDATTYPDIDYNANPPVWLDHALGITCRVQFVFKGFGTLEDSSANNLTDATAAWAQDEWAGDTVFLTSGIGAGQYALIDSSTPNTLHLPESLDVAPRKGTQYLINNGKTVQITVSWRYRNKTYSQTSNALIINYRQ